MPVEIVMQYLPYVAGIGYMALECWLGKTEKVKAGSVLEFVLIGVKGFFASQMKK